MASEQFSLCWDNFHKNMSSGMQSLLESEDLVDVTLAVEGRYLKAHKMVLSVCSPYFRELFQSNPCKHPIVFMKDVSYIALSDLLQFMYQGEVQVAQENLSTFIKTAEALQIKGLTGDNGNQNDTETESCEIQKSVVETTSKRTHEAAETKTTPVARVKKSIGPASKRPRYIIPVAESTSVLNPVASTPTTSTPISKTEASPASTVPAAEEMVHFKMEPSETGEQSQIEAIDDSQVEKYCDESGVDDIQDDTEDYTLMEAGDDEPKAGTSADGMGDGQGLFKFIVHYTGRHDLVLHQHIYRFSKMRNEKKLWVCSYSDDCAAKLYTTPGKLLSKVGTHNHLPPTKTLLLQEEKGLIMHKKLE